MMKDSLAVDIWNQPGEGAYPIAAFTYIIVYKDLGTVKVDSSQAQALGDFLWWATHDGQATAPTLGYAPLSKSVQMKVEAALKTLTYSGNSVVTGK